MPNNLSFQLDERLAAFVDEEVKAGRYGSAGEVVEAAVRLLEARQHRAKALEKALIAGEESGRPHPFDFDAFLSGKTAESEGR